MGVKAGLVQPYDANGNKLPTTNATGQVRTPFGFGFV